jgi:hypothetical protein
MMPDEKSIGVLFPKPTGNGISPLDLNKAFTEEKLHKRSHHRLKGGSVEIIFFSSPAAFSKTCPC